MVGVSLSALHFLEKVLQGDKYVTAFVQRTTKLCNKYLHVTENPGA